MIRVNKLILPLLVSILLSTVGTLKIGQDINSLFGIVLSPITTPTVFGKNLLGDNLEFLIQLPRINQENILLKKQNASLLSENQNLKDAVIDQDIVKNISSPYSETVPLRIIGIGKTITATTSYYTGSIKTGQPIVSGSILLGFVENVSSSIIHITPLDSEDLQRFPVKTGQGQSGLYLFESRTPQITDLPSEFPVNLNDSVLTLPTQLTPPNLIIGKIIKIISSPQEPLQKAEIKLEAKFSTKITDLTVITRP